MNKKYRYLLLLFLFVGASVFVVLRYNYKLKHQYIANYPLQERKGSSALAPEWAATRSKAQNLIKVVRENPGNIQSAIALATLYIQEARITGNHSYYDAAALNYINEVLKSEPENFEALTLKSLVLLSQHHFDEALDMAYKAQKSGPYNAFVYGLLVDGNVEMGNYKEAVAQAEKMISLRPDIRSYARISYLREIHGDYSGAIEAMHRAVKAGGYGDEPTSWARIQLARLHENTGDLKSAEMHYTIALQQRPGYAYALAGLGHLALAAKDYTKAIAFYSKADLAVSDFSFKEQLGRAYLLIGDRAMADKTLVQLINGLKSHAQESKGEDAGTHHVDLELAIAYLLTNKFDKALQHALAEYKRRPKNIDVNETVAWVYYKKGAFEKALPYLEAARKTGCQNPALLCRAGLIYARNNQKEIAKKLLAEALINNPNIDLELKEESSRVLQEL
jgi:tetratricopeptide (TPR) repeat protein